MQQSKNNLLYYVPGLVNKESSLRVTIKKIADIAKVSRGTVDKVLNNRPGVSDEVRKRIMEIATALDYKPNIIGKALNNQKNPFVIGVIIPPDTNPFFADIKKGINAAYQELKDFGVEIDCQVMKSLDAKEQVNNIEYLLGKGIAALALAAIEDPTTRDAVNNLIDSKIPVVTFNSDLTGSKRLCFVGQDLVKSGRVAADLLGKVLQGKGRVALITGSHHVLAHNQRVEGFRTFLAADYPDIEIVTSFETLDQDAISFELTLATLDKHPDMDGIYIAAGGIGGVCKAIKLTGLGRKVKVICTDFIADTIEFMKEGIVDFAIGQDPFAQGYRSIKILSDFLFYGQPPDADFIQTKIDIRVKENIDLDLY